MSSRKVFDALGTAEWIDYTYDDYGRLERVDLPGTNNYYTFDRDGFGRKVKFNDYRSTADNIGGTGSITYDYDATDRLSSVTDQDGYVFSYSYRSDSQVNQVRVSESGSNLYNVQFFYDSLNRLFGIREAENYPAEIDVPIGISYDVNGNRQDLTYYLDGIQNGKQLIQSYSYNLENQLTAFDLTGTGGATAPTYSFETYLSSTDGVDGLGRLVQGEEQIAQVGGESVGSVKNLSHNCLSRSVGHT